MMSSHSDCLEGSRRRLNPVYNEIEFISLCYKKVGNNVKLEMLVILSN